MGFSRRVARLALLSPLINKAVEWLHEKGDTKTADERSALKDMELSWIIARLEQFLFYLAAVAGLQVFGFAVGGWLLLKAMSKYARWGEPIKAADIPELGATALRDKEHSEFLRLQRREFFRQAGRNHNRLQIFLIGTLMSLATGGVAGVSYHYVVDLLESHPEILLAF